MAKLNKQYTGLVSFPVDAGTSVSAGDFVTMAGGYAATSVAASAAFAGVAVGASDATASVDGTTLVNIDTNAVYSATADANYAATNLGTQCDLTDGGLVDLGTSSTNVFTVVGGTVGTTDVIVAINKHQIFNA